ncbi:HAD-IA family hydrolase [Hydrogenovibrio thermophilus]|uniref:phosphoglycolate phosphatase n=1 Tax=Hydrogenovibrio thermophilus TaxID=265883 RepID=A0A451G4N3_9GAMM|nr:HAD-IA family hydrolase [Hydrogenovibrio thermophilus]QAB14438.1 HAD family hydrolase [Hydrogenovibrio thermophilus]
MRSIGAVIFDLDDTLVATSTLEDYRVKGDRQGLDANIHKSVLFKPVKGMLQAIKDRGLPLGLVTNSPRWYAEKLLRYHEIDIFDAVVCYDDVGQVGMKPSPNGIKLALEKLGFEHGDRAVYIGDHDNDFVAAYEAGIKPLAPSWAKRNPISKIPAVIISSSTLIDNLSDYEELKLIADRTAKHKAFDFPKKQMNFMPLNEDGNLVPIEKNKIKLITFGRYFSQKSALTAKLHESHQLSKDIVAKEESETYVIPQYYVNLIARVVEQLPLYLFRGTGKVFDIVTVVPAKKEKNPRLENMLKRVAKLNSSESIFIEDLFEFSKGAPSLKTLGAKANRERALHETLSIKQKHIGLVNGKSILIIDDVITTGATFSHIFSLLEGAGVSFTFGACLAKTVSTYEDAPICPKCGRQMRVRKRKDGSGIHFYGCTGYFEAENKCSHTESIKVKDCPSCGRKMAKQYNSKENKVFLGCEGFRDKTNPCSYVESYR